MRKAKIVCTLGPASDDPATIRELATAGMSVARLNASHGTPADRREVLSVIRDVDRETATPLAAMVDLKGPEIRTADVEEEVTLTPGTTVEFTKGNVLEADQIGLTVDVSAVGEGHQILIDDGRVATTVTSNEGAVVKARVDDGGPVSGRSGVNIPGVDLGLDMITDQDREDLALAANAKADFVAASFVRSADDVYAVNEVLESHGVDIPIIAKIERADAVDAIDEIIDAAYGIMVARGDLGVECPMEDVPIIQKRLIRKSQEAGVPVITATEMLDSMIHSSRPTRAEASDVANAVLDGTDAVMLSGETAVGDHPVRVVRAMDRIVRQVERSGEYAELREQRVPAASSARTEALARSARFLARDLSASAIVVASESGYTALKAAKFHASVPAIACTPSDRVRRQLSLSGGIHPTSAPLSEADGADTMIETAVQAAMDTDIVESGDTVVVLSGLMTEIESARTTNMLKVHVAAETIAMGRTVVPGRATGPLVRIGNRSLRSIPDGAILLIEDGFDGEFEEPPDNVGGFVDQRPGLTGYPAMLARELDVPMISGADGMLADRDGDEVTLDAERGVLYEGKITQTYRR